MNYRQIQTIFQDKYETGLKNAGLEMYKLPSEVIFNYIHESEIEVADELAKNKQYNYLKNLITTVEKIEFFNSSEATNLYYCTQPNDFLSYVRSVTKGIFRNMTSTGAGGLVSNEFIEPHQAGMFYNTPFNSVPIFRNPKIFLQSTNFVDPKKFYVIMPSASTLTRVDFTYVRVPGYPTNDGESLIDEAYTNKMIELAVQKALSYVIAGGAQKEQEQ